MGWSVSRHSEPDRKLALFEKRLGTLQGVVKRAASLEQVANAAEKLRLAALAVIKAKHALINEYPHRDPNGRHSHNLDQDKQRWLARSPQAIVNEYGKGDA